ncbi:MAG TPA: shikimate kinase [Chitinophagaceae bacterium]|nr:shikimate kinase [Chitinophagaceae bacterium]
MLLSNMHIGTSAYQKIFLIGFMGSGKTYWGKLWAEKSGLEFYDIDDMVEKENGKSVGEIFAQDGEEYFRSLETNVLRTFAGKNNMIVACGGGTPCYNDNVSWMNENGTSVYLKSSPQNIFKRLTAETETRPLIKKLKGEELLFYITEKIRERDFFYHQAKVILDVDTLTADHLPEFLKF